MHDGVEGEGLDAVCVCVGVLLAELPRPDGDRLVAGARCDIEAVAAAADGVDVVAVGLLLLQHRAVVWVEDDEALPDSRYHERAVRLECNVPYRLLLAILFGLQ